MFLLSFFPVIKYCINLCVCATLKCYSRSHNSVQLSMSDALQHDYKLNSDILAAVNAFGVISTLLSLLLVACCIRQCVKNRKKSGIESSTKLQELRGTVMLLHKCTVRHAGKSPITKTTSLKQEWTMLHLKQTFKSISYKLRLDPWCMPHPTPPLIRVQTVLREDVHTLTAQPERAHQP